ncbi:MAG: hypothetical protein JWM82_2590 [Myxococcales bacterium]|nr:hypothetical protein [Myxococcales bacterium]
MRVEPTVSLPPTETRQTLRRKVVRAAAFLLPVIVGLIVHFCVHVDPYQWQCTSDDQIPSLDRSEIERVALSVVGVMFGATPEAGDAMMTKEGRTTGKTLSAFVPTLRAIVARTGPFRDFSVEQTHLVDSSGSGPAVMALCGSLSEGRRDSVAMKPGFRQAHVTVAAKASVDDWKISLWLLWEDGSWKVQGVHLGAASVAGRSTDAVLALVRRENAAGHSFNAWILYNTLLSLLDRGASFRPASRQAAETEFRNLARPWEFQGEPPFAWAMNGTLYTVGRVMPITVGKQLGLAFDLPQKTKESNAAADKSNHQFLTDFTGTKPEFSTAFEFLLARAQYPDGSGFGTTYEVGKGFN